MKTLKLDIPEPCQQDWDEMSPTDKGRFCGECRKEVIDFTAMTDQQVLEYFSKNKNNFCGSFRPDQLDYVYVDRRKRFILKSKKIIASLLALISFKSVSAIGKQDSPTHNLSSQIDQSINYPETTKVAEYKIYGMVRVRDSSLLQNIPITVTVAYTDISIFPDAQGRYEIVMNANQVKEYTLITFSHPNCKFESRTIHHSRLPEELNIELDRPPSGRVGGLPAVSW